MHSLCQVLGMFGDGDKLAEENVGRCLCEFFRLPLGPNISNPVLYCCPSQAEEGGAWV